jgi:hypothetical protein
VAGEGYISDEIRGGVKLVVPGFDFVVCVGRDLPGHRRVLGLDQFDGGEAAHGVVALAGVGDRVGPGRGLAGLVASIATQGVVVVVAVKMKHHAEGAAGGRDWR